MYPLLFVILMDYPIYIDTISMKLSILYFKGLLVKISIKWCTSIPEVCIYLDKQCRPWWNEALCLLLISAAYIQVNLKLD